MIINLENAGASGGGGCRTAKLQNKEITISTPGLTTVLPNEGYDGLTQVDVNVPVYKFVVPDGMKFSYSNISALPENMDFSNVTDGHQMFSFSSFRYFNMLDFSNLVTAESMFWGTLIRTIPQFDFRNLVNAKMMFPECDNLVTLPKLNFSKVNDTTLMFYKCYNLTNLGGFTGLKTDLNLSYSTVITRQSMINVFTEAADVTASPKTITISQATMDLLSEEDKAIATNKGWNLAVE